METETTTRRPSLINRAALKKFLLGYAADNRAHSFSRVSSETLDTLEAKLRVMAVHHVETMPSVGKTI